MVLPDIMVFNGVTEYYGFLWCYRILWFLMVLPNIMVFNGVTGYYGF
jgi:hypothetical protein